MTAKCEVARVVYEQGDALVELARGIHADSEIAFSEHRSSARLVDLLSDSGFEIRTGVCGLASAFIASRGAGPLHLMLCAEYDALDDGIGHGSGRHLVGAAAAGAAIALAAFADDTGSTVSVLGTPGADLLSLKDPPAGHVRPGKSALLECGAFDGAHAVLLLVPSASFTGLAPSHAHVRWRARFRDETGGAGGALARLEGDLPRVAAAWGARSTSIRFRPAEDAGELAADVRLWAGTLPQATRAADAVRLLLETAAAAADSTLRLTEYEPIRELRQDPRLRRAFARNAAGLGIVSDLSGSRPTLTTDLGVVSARIPVIAPMFALGGSAQIGTHGFTVLSDTDAAYREMLHGAVALARTALDAATQHDLRSYLLGHHAVAPSAR